LTQEVENPLWADLWRGAGAGRIILSLAEEALPMDGIIDKIGQKFEGADRARETALRLHREVIKCSSLSIRAVHRGEFSAAEELLLRARSLLDGIAEAVKGHPEIYFGGFVQDCQKEFAEASITLALVRGEAFPDPDLLNVDYCAFVNGMGEAVGELRRHILDLMRRDKGDRCEELLGAMNDIYYRLISLDFHDAITRGLRRTTDVARAVLEKTQGDFTHYLRNKSLETSMEALRRLMEPQTGTNGD
jgi:translin